MDLWRDIVASLETAGQISPENLAVYFQATSQVRYDHRVRRLVVRVPNSRFSRWISHQYGDLLKAKMEEMGFPNAEIAFQADLDEPQSNLISSPHLLGSYIGAAGFDLNQRYTFANFVIGSSNQFAHAAALAVAERPSRSYNPLFLYGGVGLGKTHLMHAIGHSIKIEFPSVNLAYVPSERFTNDLVTSIRYDRTASFRQKYRNIDILLMDDVQFLAGKEKTQEEFFHTFNSLYDAQKQIVISSDSPPHEIPTLEERLHSRFQWGLIADIQAPDLETKVAILRKKAALQQVELPDDVAFFISSNTKSNIRQLEGSLIRLIAYSSLIGEEITIDLAQSTLKDLAASAQRVITTGEIQRGCLPALLPDRVPARKPEQLPENRCSETDRHVPLQGVDPSLSAPDRPGLRRQAPHDRASRRPEDHAPHPEGPAAAVHRQQTDRPGFMTFARFSTGGRM